MQAKDIAHRKAQYCFIIMQYHTLRKGAPYTRHGILKTTASDPTNNLKEITAKANNEGDLLSSKTLWNSYISRLLRK